MMCRSDSCRTVVPITTATEKRQHFLHMTLIRHSLTDHEGAVQIADLYMSEMEAMQMTHGLVPFSIKCQGEVVQSGIYRVIDCNSI